MIKSLYIAFQPTNNLSGISKKIKAQYIGLKVNGLDAHFCYQERDTTGETIYYVDGKVLYSIGSGLKAHLGLYYNYSPIVDYIQRKKIEFVYIRYIQIATPFFIHFLKRLKKLGVKIFLEIPTFPYDSEYSKGFLKKTQKLIERKSRSLFYKYIDRIVTFSEEKYIFSIPTLRISNGVDMENVSLRKRIDHNGINLVGVAMLAKWHGFDRIISGLGKYYRNGGTEEINFYIIGAGNEIIDQYKECAVQNGVLERIHFEGLKSADELNSYFDYADMAIGCLACHRKNVYSVKSLKNVEYAARGILFTYSEDNDDFDGQPYVLKQFANDTPININALVRFIKSNNLQPLQIRQTVDPEMSWNTQMAKVVDQLQ